MGAQELTAPALLADAGDSDRLITGSADQTVRIWDLPTGKELFQIRHREPCRAVKLSAGERFLAATSDAFIESPPAIHIYKFAENIEDQTATAAIEWTVPKGRVTRVFWTDCNRKLITSHDGGILRRWDVEVSMEDWMGSVGGVRKGCLTGREREKADSGRRWPATAPGEHPMRSLEAALRSKPLMR